MASWVKIYVEMPRHPKLFGQSLVARHLWTCLICHAKEHHDIDGTIRGQTAATLASLFNLGPARGVKAALDYFAEVGMITLGEAGEITLTDFVMRQSRMDSLEAHKRRQAEYRERKKAGKAASVDRPRDGKSDAVGDGPRDAKRDARDAITNVTVTVSRGDNSDADSDSDSEKDLDHGAVASKPREAVADSKPGHTSKSEPPKLVSPPRLPDWVRPKLRVAFGLSPETSIDDVHGDEKGRALDGVLLELGRMPAEQSLPAIAEFLRRGMPTSTKPAYLLTMAREGAKPAQKPATAHGHGPPRQQGPEVPGVARTRAYLDSLPPVVRGRKAPSLRKPGGP